MRILFRCGHCKKLAPAWDELIKAYPGSDGRLVAKVDCTAAGKPLCTTHGVKGFPTLKYGDPNDLQDYKGGRDLKALKAHADKLVPVCSPSNLHLCDDAKQAEIAKFQAMDSAALEALVTSKEALLVDADAEHKTKMEAMQKEYAAATAKKDNDIKEIKNSGLDLMRAAEKRQKLPLAGKEEL